MIGSRWVYTWMRILLVCDVLKFIPQAAGFKFETIIMISIMIREKFPPSLKDFQVSLVGDAFLLTPVNDTH